MNPLRRPRWYPSPENADELASWIEDAFDARTSRSHLIVNSQERMLYDRKCLVHGVTH